MPLDVEIVSQPALDQIGLQRRFRVLRNEGSLGEVHLNRVAVNALVLAEHPHVPLQGVSIRAAVAVSLVRPAVITAIAALNAFRDVDQRPVLPRLATAYQMEAATLRSDRSGPRQVALPLHRRCRK